MDAAGNRFHHRNKAFLNTVAHLNSVADMSSRCGHFRIGDIVRERFQSTRAGDGKGIVIKSYELSGEYRCVVKCESGREAIFFERELILVRSRS
jgi:hypothetical protein